MTLLLEKAIEEAKLDLAQGRHSPTNAMKAVSQRGVRMAQGRKNVDPAALAVGRKVASGQKLSDEHVEHMASYHAALDSPPVGNGDDVVEHMLWAGAPGSSWSGARMAAMDVSQLAQVDAPTILELDQDGKGVSLEVFVRDGLGEPVTVDADQGLIWGPILRSGMLATRPGPNGEKKHEPLIFVSGLASDPRKEIGLQNLVDSFNDNAIQHVTIPTSHENDVLSNTGFIKAVKIVDSKKRPGEKVLVAAHDFRDPDVRRKVELGTIANRSCGIVYDYINTGTGKKYEQAIDHVALTNRPWVTGMTAYGDIHGEDDFSGREVVPMLLSEAHTTDLAESSIDAWDGSPSRFTDQQWARACVLDRGSEVKDAKERYSEPVREPDGTLNVDAVHGAAERLSQVKGASLPQKKAAARSLIVAYARLGEQPPENVREVVTASTNLSEAERKAILLADVQWASDEPSMNRITDQVVAQLADFTDPDEFYPLFRVMDVSAGADPKALVKVCYGDTDGVDDACVMPLKIDGDVVTLSDHSEWVFVQKEWVADEDAAQDKQEVSSILGTDLSEALTLATLTAKERGALPASDFVFSDSREYPIHDLGHARNALSRGAQDETGKRLATIKRRVYSRYPQLKSDTKTNMSLPSGSGPLTKGGAMPPTIQEALERLGLSEEQRAVIQPLLSENQSLKTALGEVTKKSREDSVKARVQELQAKKFPPGFCRRYEEIALGDDGMVAATLNLSEGETQTGEKEYTATQIAEALISSLPYDDSGALALADRASLLTSPVSTRPPLTAEDQRKQEEKDGNKGPQSGADWLSEVAKASPEMAQQLADQFNIKLEV